MVNQLLTEMDGFRGSESVFVVGTTNFLESLDGALLRPGRFEFLIEIPAPGVQDRREIVEIYDRKLELGLSRDCRSTWCGARRGWRSGRAGCRSRAITSMRCVAR
ncbi:AAA family ATPase [Nannocystis pusilla]|uniref:AAA family ATPase n=1 Tax=Nannocystis pusilla TaxID=889268 RepID=UPI003B76C521